MIEELKERTEETENFRRTKMQKEMVIRKLRERGCRITKQRQMLLDVILNEECASCKEIYYRAAAIDAEIGSATVYRMVNLLEEIGAISRKNMYRISCGMGSETQNACAIELDDHTVCRLSAKNWYQVISEGLRICGYVKGQKVSNVMIEPCTGECG